MSSPRWKAASGWIDAAERLRDVAVQLVVVAQSVEGLGDKRQADRLLAACTGGVLTHRVADPDELVKLGGTVRYAERSTQLDEPGRHRLGQRAHGLPAQGLPRRRAQRR